MAIRGTPFNSGKTALPLRQAARCWFTPFDEAALAAEEEFLHREISPGRSVPFPRDKLTARNRFSLTVRDA